MTCTTTLLPSLGGRGGVFDVPKSKCPPDRGSSDCVTGSPASSFSSSTFSDHSSSFFPNESDISKNYSKSIIYPPSPPLEASDYSHVDRKPATAPRAIPASQQISSYRNELATPPLTPDDGVDGTGGGGRASPEVSSKQSDDALDFLLTLFPQNGLTALPFARSVSISAPNMGAAFDGVVLELPGTAKTLYVDGKSAESVSFRESIVALLDLADENLQCSALVIALERASPALGDLLHSLMYVGGTVVTSPPFKVDPAYVLVGLEI